jgi:YHS domain-containing protein
MLRTIVWLLVSVLLIAFVRGVIGLIMKGMGELFQGESVTPETARAGARAPSSAGFGGELVKDPVCGTFVAPASALSKTVRGQAHFFCSVECRDKFAYSPGSIAAAGESRLETD